jgi:hypothetical protein
MVRPRVAVGHQQIRRLPVIGLAADDRRRTGERLVEFRVQVGPLGLRLGKLHLGDVGDRQNVTKELRGLVDERPSEVPKQVRVPRTGPHEVSERRKDLVV